VSFVADFI